MLQSVHSWLRLKNLLTLRDVAFRTPYVPRRKLSFCASCDSRTPWQGGLIQSHGLQVVQYSSGRHMMRGSVRLGFRRSVSSGSSSGGSEISSHTQSAVRLPKEIMDKVDRLNEEFSEARSYLEEARDAMGTVYFQGDLDDAKAAIDDVLTKWTALLSLVSEEERLYLQRTMGLKMSQLKNELEMVLDELINE